MSEKWEHCGGHAFGVCILVLFMSTSYGKKYEQVRRMNIQVHSYLRPLEPNPPLLDTVFLKTIPSLTILESTFQVFWSSPVKTPRFRSLEGFGRGSWVAKIPAVAWFRNWLVERLIPWIVVPKVWGPCFRLSNFEPRQNVKSSTRLTGFDSEKTFPFVGKSGSSRPQDITEIGFHDAMVTHQDKVQLGFLKMVHPNFPLNKDFTWEILS